MAYFVFSQFIVWLESHYFHCKTIDKMFKWRGLWEGFMIEILFKKNEKIEICFMMEIIF